MTAHVLLNLLNPLEKRVRCIYSTRYTEFVTIFTEGFFLISLFLPNGICSNKAQNMQKIKLFLVA